MTKVLGNHPKLGHTISASIARFGPVIKMDITKSKCIYAPIMEPLTKDTITLEQALKLLEYPKDLGKYDKMCVSLNRGKHGLYLKWGDVKVSIENLPEEIIIVDKENITLDEAIAVIKDKRKNILWEKIDDKKLYSILSGPYGYYIDINDTCNEYFNTVTTLSSSDIKSQDIQIEENKLIVGKRGSVLFNGETYTKVKQDIDLDKLRNGEYNMEEIVDRTNTESKGSFMGEEIFVKKGRYGIYTTWRGKNISLYYYKHLQVEKISLENVIWAIKQNAVKYNFTDLY